MEEYQTITVDGFDSDGEPEIRLYPDGKIEVMFNFMPPSNGNPDLSEDHIFDNFEDVMGQALGVNVEREDRELFTIHNSADNTSNDLKKFLENFWSTHA